MNNNELTTIPEEFCNNLTELSYLDLRNNKLKQLPHNIGNLRKLREILVFDNELESIPSSIGKLTEIQVLKLFNNR